ncbi:MAG: hypothetical protein WKF60_01600, partial [Ilumatobacter sp.]
MTTTSDTATTSGSRGSTAERFATNRRLADGYLAPFAETTIDHLICGEHVGSVSGATFDNTS